MYCLLPQTPVGWRWDSPGAPRALNALVQAIVDRNPRVDPNRLYLTGVSMGAKGVWTAASAAPRMYAGLVPFSSVAVRRAHVAAELAGPPYVHIICGGDDGRFTIGSKQMYDVLHPTFGARCRLTIVPNAGRDIWGRFYSKPEFYTDLTRYSR